MSRENVVVTGNLEEKRDGGRLRVKVLDSLSLSHWENLCQVLLEIDETTGCGKTR